MMMAWLDDLARLVPGARLSTGRGPLPPLPGAANDNTAPRPAPPPEG